jgi:hypothetical protein
LPDYEDQRTEKKKKKKKNRDLYLSGSSDVVCTCGTYCGKGIYKLNTKNKEKLKQLNKVLHLSKEENYFKWERE